MDISGKTVVLTGTFPGFGREELKQRLVALGARVTDSLSKKTDYLFAGAEAGSKLDKAKSLGVAVLGAPELLALIGAAAPEESPAASMPASAASAEWHGIPGEIMEWFREDHAHQPKDGDFAALEALIGRPVPADLRLCWVPDSGRRSVYVPPLDDIMRAPNAFEAAAFVGEETAVRQLFTNCFFLMEGEGNGDCFFVHIPTDESKLSQTVNWDHETNTFDGPLTNDIPSLLYLWDLCEHHDDLDGAEVGRRLAALSGRYSSVWPFNRYEDDLAKKAKLTKAARARAKSFDDKSSVEPFQARAEWLVPLFVEGKFRQHAWDPAQRALDPTEQMKSPRFLTSPAAQYWLWRCFFLKEHDRARAVADKLAASPSKFLRDAASLVGELLAGRNQLGPIADVKALLESIAEFALDPAAVERRQRAEALQAMEAAIAKANSGPLQLLRTDARPAPQPEGSWGIDKRRLPGGGVITRSGAEISIAAAPGADEKPVPTLPVYPMQSPFFAVRADGKEALLAGRMYARIALPDGPARYVWYRPHQPDGVAYVAGDRIAYVDGEHLVVLEQRGPDAVPVTVTSLPKFSTHRLASVADNRILICYPAEGRPGKLGIFGVYDGRVVQLGSYGLDVASVTEENGRTFLMSSDEDRVYELVGLEEAYRAQPAFGEIGQPLAYAFARRVPEDSRETPRAPEEARVAFAGAAWTRTLANVTFAVVTEAQEPKLAWLREGIGKNIPLPELEVSTWDDGHLQIALSPRATHALVYRKDAFFLWEIDLSTGEITKTETDPGSGWLRAACYMTNDTYVYSSWQMFFVQRGGWTIHHGERCNSLAAVETAPGNVEIYGLTFAEYSSQELVHLTFEGLFPGAGKGASLKHRETLDAAHRLLTLDSQGRRIFLEARDALYELDVP